MSWYNAPMPKGTLWCGLTDYEMPVGSPCVRHPYAITSTGEAWRWVFGVGWVHEVNQAARDKAVLYALKSSLQTAEEYARLLDVAWAQLPQPLSVEGVTSEQEAHSRGRCQEMCLVCRRFHPSLET